MVTYRIDSMHRELQGKIEVVSKVEVDSIEALSTAYTPGVAEPCRVIEKKVAFTLSTEEGEKNPDFV